MAEEARAPVSEVERAEIPWVVAYLREDIQDLRNEVRETRRLTIESYEKLDAKIDARTDGLEAKIAGLRQDMDTNIKGLRQDMDAKIEARTGELRQEIGDLRRVMNVQFRWLVTTMVAVGALVVAILELLR
jgi:predicted  nucleic acid-binding Zn-ribbon protein